MHVSALEEYGLRCALQLARVHGQTHLPASKIAEKEGISIEYVSKLMHVFRKAGIVQASRGVQGGFYLSQAPEACTLKTVLEAARATSKKQSQDFCQLFSGRQESCMHIGECGMRPVWSTLYSYFDDLLSQLTLKDLIAKEEQVRAHVAMLAQQKAERIRSAFQPVLSASSPGATPPMTAREESAL